LVRATTARLLTIIVTTSGADKVLSPTANIAFKGQVLSAAVILLEDVNDQVRYGVCVNCCQFIWRQQCRKKVFLEFPQIYSTFLAPSTVKNLHLIFRQRKKMELGGCSPCVITPQICYHSLHHISSSN
jgi:hypothetical protein